MPAFDFPTLGLLLFAASLVAMLTRRIGMPYTVGLVIAGMGLAIFPTGISFKLTPQLAVPAIRLPRQAGAGRAFEYQMTGAGQPDYQEE